MYVYIVISIILLSINKKLVINIKLWRNEKYIKSNSMFFLGNSINKLQEGWNYNEYKSRK